MRILIDTSSKTGTNNPLSTVGSHLAKTHIGYIQFLFLQGPKKTQKNISHFIRQQPTVKLHSLQVP